MNLCTYDSVICAIQNQTGPFDFDVVLGELMQQFPGEREDSLRSILAQVWKRICWVKVTLTPFVTGISETNQTGLQREPQCREQEKDVSTVQGGCGEGG